MVSSYLQTPMLLQGKKTSIHSSRATGGIEKTLPHRQRLPASRHVVAVETAQRWTTRVRKPWSALNPD